LNQGPDKRDSLTKTWRYVFPYFKRYKKRLALLLVLSLAASVFEPGLAFLAKPVVRYLVGDPEGGKRILWLIPVGIIVLFVLREVLTFAHLFLMECLSIRVVSNIQVALYRHYMFLSLEHYERTTTGEMMSRTTQDIGQMQSIVPLVLSALQQVFKLAGLAAVCFIREPLLSVFTMLTFPPIVFLTQRISMRMKNYTKQGLAQAARIFSFVQETYAGAKVVKAFAREEEEIRRFSRTINDFLGLQFRYVAAKQIISPMVGAIAACGLAAIAYFLCRRVLYAGTGAAESASSVVSYVMALALMYEPVRKLGQTSGLFTSAQGAAERIWETFEKQSRVCEAPGAVELPAMKGVIRYENVSFRYNQDWVLKDLSFDARQGELVALVGSSGVGKTTIVNLLPRFYDVTNGSITIDGVDIRAVTFRSLRLQMGIVTQDTFLFNDSVFNNILYGSEGKTPEAVMAAAQAAYAVDFIRRLPKGYDTIIGERGATLSGGERQRIAIARALLKDPPILILDEATSSLDTASEREVQKALDAFMANRTTIVIAHRLSTIRHADKILVIRDGRVAEQGTHEELMAGNGGYKKLYEMQFSSDSDPRNNAGDSGQRRGPDSQRAGFSS